MEEKTPESRSAAASSFPVTPTESEAAVESQREEGLLQLLRSDLRLHGRVFTRCYLAMVTYRLGNWAATELPEPVRSPSLRVYGWMEKFTRVLTGVHMDRRVRVGRDFHIIHAEGNISIHPDVVIGDRVGIMHNVTIGMDPKSARLPRIGNDVFIGVGAVIIGDVTIGDRVSIAANSLVISDVPSDSVAIGVPAKHYSRLSKPLRPATRADSVPPPPRKSGKRP